MNWMVTTIVVPSDGSTAVEPQLASARALARATGARVVVAHINELARDGDGPHPVHPGEEVLEASVREQVHSLQRLGVRAELDVQASSDDVAQAIAELATKRDADLIVTRKGRHGTLLGPLSGDVSRRLLRLAPCPVLVVPCGQ